MKADEMSQTNDARHEAVTAYMDEHDVSYTAAQRHFEAEDAELLRSVSVDWEAAAIEYRHSRDEDFPVTPEFEHLLGHLLSEHRSEEIPVGELPPVPSWMHLDNLSRSDQADSLKWLACEWALTDRHTGGWGERHGARSSFLCSAVVDGVATAEYVHGGEPRKIVFFRGGGAVFIPKCLTSAVVGPPAGKRALAYVNRWVKAMRAADDEYDGKSALERALIWHPDAKVRRVDFAPASARERIGRYHPSMERLDVDVTPAVRPDPNLPWLDLADLSAHDVHVINAFLEDEDSLSEKYGKRSYENAREYLMAKGACAAQVFVFGEGQNMFSFGVIGLQGLGAVVVPAPLARAAHLPQLSEKFAHKGRRYGTEIQWRLEDGEYSAYGDWPEKGPISVAELEARPPANSASADMVDYDPVGDHAVGLEWKVIDADGLTEEDWEVVRLRLDQARNAAHAAACWPPRNS
jgi:hypothetical protein